MKAKQVGDGVHFYCPGCKGEHRCTVSGPGAVWHWNGSLDAPTLSPSVLIRTGHYSPYHTGAPCWCTWTAEHPEDPCPFTCTVCHSFVRDGRIEFLPDCTHALAGHTVDLPDTHP